jgi:16S rRNA (guanine527-N7)-methyltransferase
MEDIDQLKNILVEGAESFSIHLNELQFSQFIEYKNTLKSWNQKINLTAIEDDKEIIIKHFIDSFSIYPHIKGRGNNLIDIGTGAGFPGIPIKIVCQKLKVTLLDSLKKRVKFLDYIVNSLGLEEISSIHGRAEDYGNNSNFREKFDIVTARAVANLPVLLEYCLPLVKIGGIFVAMKGSNIDEISDSKKALKLLGGEINEVQELTLPFSDIKRNIIIVKKLRHTPTNYPRKAGKPSKEPLL